MTGSLYQRLLSSLSDSSKLSSDESLCFEVQKAGNKVFAEVLCPLFVVRKDAQFREFLRMEEEALPQ